MYSPCSLWWNFFRIRLEGRPRKTTPEPVAQQDRRQVQGENDPDQQQRRRVYHGLRRFDVGRLEPDIVDVKAQMHELAVEVEKGPVAVQRQARGELHHAR